MTGPVILTDKQRRDLLAVCGRFAPPITHVDVYGSRARGDARPGSDVDLMLGGAVSGGTLRLVARALDDSYLSIFADVSAYTLLAAGPFADEVARTAVTLFTAEDLAGAPPFRPVEGLDSWYRPVAA